MLKKSPLVPPSSPFILVDGSSYLFRAYHALPPLMNAEGEPTGAIFGAINMLKRLMSDYQPQHMAVVFDSKEKNFRHTLYPAYKANRGEMPEELMTQIAPLYAIIQALGIPLMVVPGVEADDVIGTLSTQAKAWGWFTLIASNDKDMAQLVNDQVWLIDTMKHDTIDRARVYEKHGVYPEQMVDYLALVGDTVDNVPGIPQVGPKTAAKWLAEYGDIETLLANGSKIKGKVGESLLARQGDLPLYRELVTILTSLSLPENFHDANAFCLKPQDPETLRSWFERLGFKKMLAKVLLDFPVHGEAGAALAPVFKPIDSVAAAVNGAEALQSYLNRLPLGETLSLLFEQAQTSPLGDCLALALDYPSAESVLLVEGSSMAAVQEGFAAWLREQAALGRTQLIAAASRSCLHFLKSGGINLVLPVCAIQDLSLLSYLLNSTAGKHDLNTLLQQHLGWETPLALGEAVQGVHQIFERLSEKMNKTSQPLSILYETIELPLAEILLDMEATGVLVDASILLAQSQELEQKLTALEAEAFTLAGQCFNLNSPQQLQDILFDKLQLPILEKTPTGKPSTGEQVLQELSHQHALPATILTYRSLSKLKSTYTDKLPQQINPITGRVHTHYHQTVTATGRLSSSDPNLQNIPIRSEEGRRIRRAFIAPPGKVLLSADYSQIELRIMAHLAQDPGLIEAFTMGEDIHRSTAAAVFHLPLSAVDQDTRSRAKAINFGLIYGMSAFGLSKQLGVSAAEAESFIQQYFARFPKVQTFMQQTKSFATVHGYVETLLGRRLYLPDITAKYMVKRKAAERAAINAPLQGTAADLIKKAMIDIVNWIRREQAPASLIMQVHDELVFEVEEAHQKEMAAKIKALMEGVMSLSVDLVVDVGVGLNWEAAH